MSENYSIIRSLQKEAEELAKRGYLVLFPDDWWFPVSGYLEICKEL